MKYGEKVCAVCKKKTIHRVRNHYRQPHSKTGSRGLRRTVSTCRVCGTRTTEKPKSMKMAKVQSF